MTDFYVPNDRVATEPFPVRHLKSEVNAAGVVVINQLSQLQELRVVFGNEKFPAGTRIWVAASAATKTTWGKEQPHEIEGQKIMFVPHDAILLVDRSNLPDGRSSL